MLHCLMYIYPEFLLLNDKWVDRLILTESDIILKEFLTPLDCLFRSKALHKFDFNCDRFKTFFSSK